MEGYKIKLEVIEPFELSGVLFGVLEKLGDNEATIRLSADIKRGRKSSNLLLIKPRYVGESFLTFKKTKHLMINGELCFADSEDTEFILAGKVSINR